MSIVQKSGQVTKAIIVVKMPCKLFYVIHKRSADTNLVEIHEEMSELLDKQVYVLKIRIKIPGFTQGSRKPT